MVNKTTRLWEQTGSRPRCVQQQQFEYAYLFGAVYPSTGATEAIIAPCVNMNVMREHLSLISERHPVIIVDGADWHQDYLADEFPNLPIIQLPPYSPELNLIGQVWQWLRQNELANRRFEASWSNVVEHGTASSLIAKGSLF